MPQTALSQKEIPSYVAAQEVCDIPDEVWYELLAGQHPIAVWRDYRGIAPRDLAVRVGISVESLMAIERDELPVAWPLVHKLAIALQVDEAILARPRVDMRCLA